MPTSDDRPELYDPASMGTPARGRSRIRRILGWIELGLLVLVVGFWFFALRPQGLGGPASYALVSGTSMLPKYHTGDIVIVHHHARYRVGDIVAYKVPKGQVGAGAEVIHRIVGGSAGAGWIMQGDNRTAPDIWHPKNDLIVGRAWVHIAKAGIVIKLLHTPLFLGGLAALVAMLSVLFHKPKRARGPKADAEPVADPTLPAAGDDPPSWVTHARVDRVPHRVAAAPAEPEPAPAHESARPLGPNPATWPFWEFRVGPEHRYAEYELAPAYREPEPGL